MRQLSLIILILLTTNFLFAEDNDRQFTSQEKQILKLLDRLSLYNTKISYIDYKNHKYKDLDISIRFQPHHYFAEKSGVYKGYFVVYRIDKDLYRLNKLYNKYLNRIKKIQSDKVLNREALNNSAIIRNKVKNTLYHLANILEAKLCVRRENILSLDDEAKNNMLEVYKKKYVVCESGGIKILSMINEYPRISYEPDNKNAVQTGDFKGYVFYPSTSAIVESFYYLSDIRKYNKIAAYYNKMSFTPRLKTKQKPDIDYLIEGINLNSKINWRVFGKKFAAHFRQLDLIN